MLVTFRIDHEVRHAGQSLILDRKHLFLGMAMAMALAKTILGGHLIVAKKSAYFMTKGGILAGRGDVGWIARGMNVSRVEHDVDGAPDPREQSRELMAAEFVAAAEHFGAAIRIDGE